MKYIRSLLLFVGTGVSWSTVAWQFLHPLQSPNPFATPCFYGACAFALAFLWSLYAIKKPHQKIEQWLSFFLLFGTAFALTVIGIEMLQYCGLIGGPTVGCIPNTNPLLTPCAAGAVLFFTSFILSTKIRQYIK